MGNEVNRNRGRQVCCRNKMSYHVELSSIQCHVCLQTIGGVIKNYRDILLLLAPVLLCACRGKGEDKSDGKAGEFSESQLNFNACACAGFWS